jgi:hypothetical protein
MHRNTTQLVESVFGLPCSTLEHSTRRWQAVELHVAGTGRERPVRCICGTRLIDTIAGLQSGSLSGDGIACP